MLSLLRSDLVMGGVFGSQPSAAGAGGGGAGGIGESVNYPAPGYSKGPGNLLVLVELVFSILLTVLVLIMLVVEEGMDMHKSHQVVMVVEDLHIQQ